MIGGEQVLLLGGTGGALLAAATAAGEGRTCSPWREDEDGSLMILDMFWWPGWSDSWIREEIFRGFERS